MLSIVTATTKLTDTEVEAFVKHFDKFFETNTDFEILVQDSQSDPFLIGKLEKRDYVNLDSKPDSGIYEAWNSALNRANGDRITFIGIDDLPYMNWLEFAIAYQPKSSRFILACDVALEDLHGEIIGTFQNPRSGKLDTLSNNFSHPGLVISRDVYMNNEFLTSYKIISDLVFYARFQDLFVTAHFGMVGVVMKLGGISNSAKGSRRVLLEYLKAIYKGDVNPYPKLIVQRLFAALLSFSPPVYRYAQRHRWKRRNQGPLQG